MNHLQEDCHSAAIKPDIRIGTKYRWSIQPADPTLVQAIAHTHNISIPIAHVLASRGFHDHTAIRTFLFSSYEQAVAPAHLLKGITAATQRIIQAIQTKEKILVFGDYDVDGVTSASIMLSALLPLGANINFFLPHREKDGYGLSAKAVQQAYANKYTLIITVDNGITAFDAIQMAKNIGIDVIVTDHHKPHDQLPAAYTIVNPQQEDCAYPFKNLAGVGVTFKLIFHVYQTLGIQQLPEKIYELLLLGTIADVVPLIGENRYWVRYCLDCVNHNKSTALSVLAQNGNLTKDALTSLDIAFMIAPQINALGRLSDARDAVKFMISSNSDDINTIGQTLKKLNEERKFVEQGIYTGIEKLIATKEINLDQDPAIVAAHTKWPSGVIGLVAGKLAHNYGRPALLFHLNKDEDIAKGSCRSIQEIDIFSILNQQKDLLLQFGGHAHAAGLKLKISNFETFKERLFHAITAIMPISELYPKLLIDAPLQLPEVTNTLLDDHDYLEPFGNRNTQPLFLVSNVNLLKPPQLLKERHVKCMVFSQGTIKPVIFFNRPDLMETLTKQEDKPFDLAAHVTKNEWGGTVRSELQGIDIAV